MLTKLKMSQEGGRVSNQVLEQVWGQIKGLGIYAYVCVSARHQVSALVARQTFMKIRSSVELVAEQPVYWPLKDALEETL